MRCDAMSRKTHQTQQQQQQTTTATITMATHRHARINNALRVLTPVCQNALATEVEEEGGGGRERPATMDEVKIYTNI